MDAETVETTQPAAVETSAPAEASSAALTDDQIFDNALSQGSEPQNTEPQASAEPPQADAGRTEKNDQEGPQEETPTIEIPESEQLKTIFKTPGVGQDLRRAYYAEKAYREVFPTVQEARQIREIFPTAQDAQEALSEREEFAKFDSLYHENTPQSHAEFVKSMADDDPRIFSNFASQFPAFVNQLAPEVYRSQIASPIVEATLQNLRQSAEQRGDENARNAVDVLAQQLFGRPVTSSNAPQSDPRLSQIQMREQQVSQRENAYAQQQFNSFFQASNDQVVEKIVGDIELMVKKALPEGTSERTIQKITGDTYNALDAKLRENRDLRLQVQRAYQAARQSRGYGLDAQSALVNLVHSRAKQILPLVAKEVITDWTQGILRSNHERIQKQRDAASRVDIGSGGAPSIKAGKFDLSKIDYRKMSDDDILKAAGL